MLLLYSIVIGISPALWKAGLISDVGISIEVDSFVSYLSDAIYRNCKR